MGLPQIFRDIFANNGKGPKLLPGIMPIAGNGEDGDLGAVKGDGASTFVDENGVITASGYSLLDIKWSATGLIDPGFIDLSQDNGLLLRSAYPQAWEKVAQAMAANTGAVVDDTAWVAERDANGGVCGKFSAGDGSTTFRVPLLRKRAGFGFPDPDTGAGHGDFLPDRMRPVTGWFSMPTGNSVGADGAIKATYVTTYGGNNITTYGATYTLDTARLGDNYNGDITHGPLIIYTPLMKMYGAVTEGGEANIAELIQQTNAKLDTAAYEADAWGKPVASVLFTATGEILWSHNIASVEVISNHCRLTFDAPLPDANYGASAMEVDTVTLQNIAVLFYIPNSTAYPKTPAKFDLVALNYQGTAPTLHTIFVNVYGKGV